MAKMMSAPTTGGSTAEDVGKKKKKSIESIALFGT